MSSPNLKRAAASGVIWNLLQNLVGRLLGLLVMAILARLLDKSAFGAIAVSLSVTALAELMLNQGYGEFLAQRSELTDEHRDTTFWFNAAGGLALTLGVTVAAQPIASFLDEPALSGIIRALSVVLFLRSLAVVPTALLVRDMRFRSLSLRSVLGALVGGAIGISSALAGVGLYSLVLQILTAEIVSLAMLWGATTWRPGRRASRATLREILSFGGPIFGAGLMSFVTRRLDAGLIAARLGLSLLGVYSIAQRVFQIANQIINKSADAVAFSALARLANEPERRRDAFLRSSELTAVLCFPLYAGLATVATEVVMVIFGERWAEAGPVLAVFALAGLPVSLSYLHSATLKAAGKTRSFLALHVTIAVIYAPLLFLLVGGGPMWAAVAYLVSVYLMTPLELVVVCAALGIRTRDYLRTLLAPIAASTLMATATYLLTPTVAELTPILALVAKVLLGVIVYALALRVVSRTIFDRVGGELRTLIMRKRDLG